MTIDMQKTVPADAEHDDVGRDLVVRPDDDLELRRPADLVPYRPVQTLVVRARQATARGWVSVVDQPAVVRSVAVTKQSPRAVGRLAKGTPRGAKRAVLLLDGWLRDPESIALMSSCAEQQDAIGYEKAAAAREKKNLPGRRRIALAFVSLALVVGLAWWAPQAFAGVLAGAVLAGGGALAVHSTRGRDLLVALMLVVGLAVAAWYAGPWLAGYIPQPPAWIWWAVLATGVLVFGWLGRKPDQPLMQMPLDRLVASNEPAEPKAEMVVDALCRLGIAGLTPSVLDQVRAETRIIAPGVGRSRRGWHLQLELPWAITAGQVMDKREQLAAALKRELGTVWPSQGPRHPGHLELFLAHRPMASAPQDPWPVAEAGRVDIFERLPMFTDQEGDWVDLQIAYKRIVIGGESGSGKSFYARQIGVACALDPRTRIVVFDGKANGDMDPLVPVAHGFYVGARPEEMAEQLTAAQAIEREMDRRARFLRTLPREDNPENKVTSALVDRFPDLAPYLVIVDELQEYTQAEDKAMAKEFTRIFTRFSRLGRSAGIIPVIATQYPDSTVVPVPMRSNFSTKFCLRVEGHQQVEVILGTGSYAAGLQANKFTASEAGLAWHKGDGQEPAIVRSVFGLDGPVCDELVERARLLRARLGMLTGQAADGDDTVDAEVVYDMADDVERLLRQHGRESAQWEELLPWMRDLREQWAALTKDELSAGVRASGVRVADVRVAGATRKGVYLADLRKRGREDDGD